jgi:prepilin-type N-terminal cleavage/methylation domain-containing protein
MFNKKRKTLRIARDAARSQVGMTLLEIMIVLAIIAVVMGLLVGPRVISMFKDSQVQTTQLMVQSIANDSYTHWTLKTSKQCPDSLDDLKEFMNKPNTKDGWGNELIMLCGDDAPEGASSGFGVLSKGADGKRDTDDDVKSWE